MYMLMYVFCLEWIWYIKVDNPLPCGDDLHTHRTCHQLRELACAWLHGLLVIKSVL